MEFSLLADEPGAAITVAQWYFDEWCKDTGRYSFEFIQEKVSASTNRDQAPLIVLAKESDTLLGSAELKIREMDAYPQYEYWLGGVYVAKPARNKGIGSALVNEVVKRAEELGIKKLYLQTENLSGGLYTKHGFEPIEQTDSKGLTVLVMVAHIGV
jgi:GNAT superfamily N-acetyltransferase